MAGKRPPTSAAERALRNATTRIVGRVSSGATIYAACGADGYDRRQVRDMLTIAADGLPEVTDPGYRAACKLMKRKVTIAMSERDTRLAERWQDMATGGDDWRSIAELLKRLTPEDWMPTEKSSVQIDADVRTETRGEDAVLEALKRLQGEKATDG